MCSCVHVLSLFYDETLGYICLFYLKLLVLYFSATRITLLALSAGYRSVSTEGQTVLRGHRMVRHASYCLLILLRGLNCLIVSVR